MKRQAEAVLNGHPDKFCDIIADRMLRETYRIDDRAYGQIEAAVWSDQIFLTGAVVTRVPAELDTATIIRDAGLEIGYTPENHIDVNRYVIHDHICRVKSRPERWTEFVNDQCIIHGYAGYDTLTRFLPPEQFAVWFIREQLVESFRSGTLKDYGPDGKVLLMMEEYPGEWLTNTLLVTLQQSEQLTFLEYLEIAGLEIRRILDALASQDRKSTRLNSSHT